MDVHFLAVISGHEPNYKQTRWPTQRNIRSPSIEVLISPIRTHQRLSVGEAFSSDSKITACNGSYNTNQLTFLTVYKVDFTLKKQTQPNRRIDRVKMPWQMDHNL